MKHEVKDGDRHIGWVCACGELWAVVLNEVGGPYREIDFKIVHAGDVIKRDWVSAYKSTSEDASEFIVGVVEMFMDARGGCGWSVSPGLASWA